MNSQAVASLAKISVRTLHYYDKIGLLVPHRNEWNDYREYSEADLATLQQICFFKTCGFSLATIQKLLTSSTFDKSEAFQLQKACLLRERARLDTVLETLERSIQEMKGKITMTQTEKFKGFDFTREAPFKAEAIERWGSQALAQTDTKLDSLSSEDKADLSQKLTSLFEDLAKLQDEPPASKVAQATIDQMYQTFNTSLMKAQDVKFVVASGNQYAQLISFFPEIANELTFAAENGAYLVSQAQDVFAADMARETVATALSVLATYADSHGIVCGKKQLIF